MTLSILRIRGILRYSSADTEYKSVSLISICFDTSWLQVPKLYSRISNDDYISLGLMYSGISVRKLNRFGLKWLIHCRLGMHNILPSQW